MQKIEDNFNQLHNARVNNESQKYSDNTSELNKFFFWRVEYNQDSQVENKPFIKSITKHNTWSNYGNQGQLKVFEKK